MKDSTLADYDIKEGDVLLCTMLEDNADNPEIKITLPHARIFYRTSEDKEFYSCWLVYAGNKDLTGFINDESLNKAKLTLEKLNE